MGLFHPHDPILNGLCDLRLRTGRQLWDQNFGSLPPVGLCPALDRVAAYSKLFTQHGGAAALFQVQTHYL